MLFARHCKTTELTLTRNFFIKAIDHDNVNIQILLIYVSCYCSMVLFITPSYIFFGNKSNIKRCRYLLLKVPPLRHWPPPGLVYGLEMDWFLDFAIDVKNCKSAKSTNISEWSKVIRCLISLKDRIQAHIRRISDCMQHFRSGKFPRAFLL